MTRQEIFKFINDNPAFFLATVEKDIPRVRGMLIYRANEDGIVFHTGTMKDVYKQIMKNPNVELCFNDFKSGVQVRVSGKLEVINDNKFKDEISEHPTREFLSPWKNSLELRDFYKQFVVFNLKNGIATTWAMDENLVYPKVEIRL